MMRLVLVLVTVLAFGCKKDDKAKSDDKPKAAPVATVGSDGVRTIAIEANADGYVPDKIKGKPGEKLKLRFTRTIDGQCLEQLKTPDGKIVELPKNTAVDVDVTVPADGEVKFACGMDMFFTVVVAEKA